MDLMEYAEGGIGALVGGVLVALGLKSKINNIYNFDINIISII